MLKPGTLIQGRYQIIKLLAQGGMSNIYLCTDARRPGITLVLKEFTALYSDPKEQAVALRYFQREAYLLNNLSHPNLPVVYDYFQFNNLSCLVMDYIEGEDMGKILERTCPLPVMQAGDWIMQTATVLYYLHSQKPEPIIFRDIKPSNIIICKGIVKLIDFGIARCFSPVKKGDTMRIGSPGYAPPEQYNGQSDPRSDIYALGVTLHYALTGRDPSESQSPFVLPPARELNPSVPEAVETVIKKATKLIPEERYQNALDFKRDLKQALGLKGATLPASVYSPAPPVLAAGQPQAPQNAKPQASPSAQPQTAQNSQPQASPSSPSQAPQSSQSQAAQGSQSQAAQQASASAPSSAKPAASAPASQSSQPASQAPAASNGSSASKALNPNSAPALLQPAPLPKKRSKFKIYSILFFILASIVLGYLYYQYPQEFRENVKNLTAKASEFFGKERPLSKVKGIDQYLHGDNKIICANTLFSEFSEKPDYIKAIYLENSLWTQDEYAPPKISKNEENSQEAPSEETVSNIRLGIFVPESNADLVLRGIYSAQKRINGSGGIYGHPLIVMPHLYSGSLSASDVKKMAAGDYGRRMLKNYPRFYFSKRSLGRKWYYHKAKIEGETPQAIIIFADPKAEMDVAGDFQIPVLRGNIFYDNVELKTAAAPELSDKLQLSAVPSWAEHLKNMEKPVCLLDSRDSERIDLKRFGIETVNSQEAEAKNAPALVSAKSMQKSSDDGAFLTNSLHKYIIANTPDELPDLSGFPPKVTDSITAIVAISPFASEEAAAVYDADKKLRQFMLEKDPSQNKANCDGAWPAISDAVFITAGRLTEEPLKTKAATMRVAGGKVTPAPGSLYKYSSDGWIAMPNDDELLNSPVQGGSK